MNFFKGLKRESNGLTNQDEVITERNNSQQDQNYEQIIAVAADILSTHDFEKVTFQEIASASGLDQALVNKYFTTKTELIFATAYHFLSPQYNINDTRILENMTGLEAIEVLFDEKVRLFLAYPIRYLFLDKLERYMNSQKYLRQQHHEEQRRYEQAVRSNESLWRVYMMAGLNDQSIRRDIDINYALQTFSTLMVTFFEKTVLSSPFTDLDESTCVKNMLPIIKEMIRRYLKA